MCWLQGKEEASIVWGNLSGSLTSHVLSHITYNGIYVSPNSVPGLRVTVNFMRTRIITPFIRMLFYNAFTPLTGKCLLHSKDLVNVD